MEKESDYLVRNPKLIAEHLTDIIKKKCIISAEFGENKVSFLTAIIQLDPKNNILTLDCGPTELLTNQLLNSAKVLFRTEMNGIKVSFSGKGIRKSKSNGHAVFEMPIPSAIFWMQRRQFYRVKIPLSHVGSFCKIIFGTEQPDNRSDTQSARFQLSDISICGFSFLNPDVEVNRLFETNKSVTQCTLYLHEADHSRIDFIIKDVSNIKASTTTTQQRIGCRFTEVSSAFESCILRYMQDIERQLKNITGC